MAIGYRGFRWSCNLGVLARGENCTNVHLARLIAGVQKAGLDVHDASLASGSAAVLGYEVSANAYYNGTGKRMARTLSVARTVSSRRRISSRAMELVNGHEFSLALSNRGALSQSLTLASSSRGRPILVSGEPWSTVRLEQ